MLLTLDHFEVATKCTKAKPHRYWENAQLVPSNAYLISIDAENGNVQWNVVATNRALRCFLEENHVHYEIVSMYRLEADPDKKTKLRLVEVTTCYQGIFTETEDGRQLTHVLPTTKTSFRSDSLRMQKQQRPE